MLINISLERILVYLERIYKWLYICAYLKINNSNYFFNKYFDQKVS